MKKRLIAAIVLIVVVTSVIFFYRMSNSRDRDILLLSGNVEVTEVNIGFKVPGRVRFLYTDEGKTVASGDKIASLDNAEYESVVSQNKAAVQNAEAQLDKARKDYDRFSKLFQEGVISTQQMDSAKTAYDIASSQLRMYSAALKTAEVRLSDTVICAPLSGAVLRKNVEEGETISAGAPVVSLGDLGNPWIKVYVKEDKLGMVQLGQKAEVMIDSFPKKRYEGTITYIASEAEFTPKNVQTREERVKLVFSVKVSVKNQNNELKPGMPADVKIFVKQ